MSISAEAIDRAAKHLRETTQKSGTPNMKPWADLPKSVKKKWIELATGTLKAAAGDTP
jgi:hypothetical protein